MMRSFDPALERVPAGDPRLDVPDPWYGDHDGFADVLAMLEAAAEGLVADLPLLLDR
jgi:protein-tyrosine phosphatase